MLGTFLCQDPASLDSHSPGLGGTDHQTTPVAASLGTVHVLFVQKRVHNVAIPNNEHKLDTPVHVLVAAKYLSNLGAITVVVRR
jgi:hypothetical protein